MNNNLSPQEPFINADNPYAGLLSFQEEDKDYFFGRDQEINTLSHLIKKNTLTLVFGKSGIGKTSLLQAGLSPWIRKNYYLPVYIRLNSFDTREAALMQIKKIIWDVITRFYPDIPGFGEKTLWEFFYEWNASNRIVRPLLIFDQFEEIFILKESNPKAFQSLITEIADLIENRIPDSIQENQEHIKQHHSFTTSPSHFRVIFSIREDFLAQLEAYTRIIPSLRTSRLYITKLRCEAALEAIKKPAKKLIKTDDVAIAIIKKIQSGQDTASDQESLHGEDELWKTKEIEPFILSLFCFQANEKRKKEDKTEITRALIDTMKASDILLNYYEEHIANFPHNVRLALEDRLVSDKGSRKLEVKEDLKLAFGLSDAQINELVGYRLIRQEIREGTLHVELIHDQLAKILKKKRDKRIQNEQLAEEKKADKAKQQKKLRFIYLSLVIIFFLLGVYSLILQKSAQTERDYAEKQKEIADKLDILAKEQIRQRMAYEWAAYAIDLQQKDPILSFKLATMAYKKDNTNLVAHRALLSVFYENSFYQKFNENLGKSFLETNTRSNNFFAAYSPDGHYILTVAADEAILWNANSYPLQPYKKRRIMDCFSSSSDADIEFRAFATFSPDNSAIAFCTTEDNQLLLWDYQNNQCQRLLIEGEMNAEVFQSVSFLPGSNKKILMIVCKDNQIRELELENNSIKNSIPITVLPAKPQSQLISASFSPDGNFMAVTALDNMIRIWDIKNRAWQKRFKTEGKIAMVSFLPIEKNLKTQNLLLAGGIKTIQMWDLQFSQKMEEYETNGVMANFCNFSDKPEGKFVVIGMADPTEQKKVVRLFKKDTFLLKEFELSEVTLTNVVFSPDGRYILIAPSNGPAQIRPIAPVEMIKIVNKLIPVRKFTPAENKIYKILDNEN